MFKIGSVRVRVLLCGDIRGFCISLHSLSRLRQDYQRQMQKLDGGIEEVNGWIDGAEKKMNEMDRQGPNDAVLKVQIFIFMHLYLCLYFAKVNCISHFYDLFSVLVHFTVKYFI